jgi:hypothetical protein
MICMEHLLRPDFNRDWLSLILISSIAILALLRYAFPRRTSELFLLPFNDKYFALEGRQKGFRHPFNGVMLMLQILAFGLFLTLTISPPNEVISALNPETFMRTSRLVLIYVLLRYGLDWIMGEVLDCQPLLNQYRYERFSYHHLISVLFIASFAIAFFALPSIHLMTPVFIFLFLLGLVLTLIYSIRRNSVILFRNFLYFILYICALEIAPYVLLYTVARGYG